MLRKVPADNALLSLVADQNLFSNLSQKQIINPHHMLASEYFSFKKIQRKMLIVCSLPGTRHRYIQFCNYTCISAYKTHICHHLDIQMSMPFSSVLSALGKSY